MEQDDETQRWFEIHPKKAMTKASQALRENYTSDERAAKRARYRLKKEQEQHQQKDEEEVEVDDDAEEKEEEGEEDERDEMVQV